MLSRPRPTGEPGFPWGCALFLSLGLPAHPSSASSLNLKELPPRATWRGRRSAMECLGSAGPVCVVLVYCRGQTRRLAEEELHYCSPATCRRSCITVHTCTGSPLPVCAPEPLRLPYQGPMTTKDSKKVGSSCGPNQESRTAPPSASRPPLARGCNPPLNTHLYTNRD